MDETFMVSPAWAARTRFTGSNDPKLVIEPLDLAIAVRVAGAVNDDMPTTAHDLDAFVERMRRSRDDADPSQAVLDCYVRMADIGLTAVDRWERSIERLRHLRNDGHLCFTSITLSSDRRTATFLVAGGPGMIGSHRVFSHRMSLASVRKASRWLPLSDRPHVTVNPRVMARFASASSVPVALRLEAWLRARSAEGLPPPSRVSVDDHERWLVRAEQDDVARYLGITTGRSTLRYYGDLFPRIRRDLASLGFDFRAIADPVHRRRCDWRLRFHCTNRFVDQSPDRDDELDDIEHDNSIKAPTSLIARPSAPVTEPAAPVEFIVEEPVATIPAPEPIVRPRPAPRGRMKGNVVAEPDRDVEPSPKDVSEPITAPKDVAAPLPIDDGRNGKKPISAPVIDRAALAMRDVRPPWLRRRLVHRHPMLPNVFADRPLDTYIACEDAYRVGVHVWADGLGAQPERIEGMSVMDGAVAVGKLWDHATRRLEWVNWVCTYPNGTWEPEDHQYLDMSWDDPEDDLPAARRTKPRDLTNPTSLPHDGLGYVDDDGNPVDAAGRPMDRSEVEQEWDDLVQVPVDVV